MEMELGPAASTITQCQWCHKVKSPTQRILACTRCFSVGYCCKSCQKADWKGVCGGGHKSRCMPISTTARLEVKRSDEDRWDDLGPINLVQNIANCSFDSANATINGHYRETATQPRTDKRKELPIRTRRILGQQSTNTYNYQQSHDGIDENLLIFFHGAGDSHVPYAALGKKMELPQTAVLSLGASMSLSLNLSCESCAPDTPSTFVELPFDLGHTWFEEMDLLTGEPLPRDHPRRLKSLKHALKLMDLILCSLTGLQRSNHEGVHESPSWIPERVFLLGFSAGGSLAMEICRMWMNAGRLPLGGAVCVAGGIQTELETVGIPCSSSQRSKPTDVLIIIGDNDESYPKEAALLSKQLYHPSNVQLHVQKGKGHSMLGTKYEMQSIMEFFSQRLVRRLVSMEGCSI